MQSEVIRNAHSIGHFRKMKVEKLLCRDNSIITLQGKIERVIQNYVLCT